MKFRCAISIPIFLLAAAGCGGGLLTDGAPSAAVLTLNLEPKWQRLEASWGGAALGSGFLLVRNSGGPVSWVPSNRQVYRSGQAVTGSHVVVFSGSATSATDSGLTNGATYYYQIFSYNSAYRYTAGAREVGVAGITCPTGYLVVAPNTDVLVNDAFCVAKYEMKNDGSNNAVSQSSGLPWVDISRDDGGGVPVGPGAVTRCQNIGPGYDLVSNAQWQAVAREIENAEGAGVYLNWSNGSLSGANALNRGHSDNSPGALLAASLDSDPCFGTGNPSCANNAAADFIQKRTHTLSSGEIIWDVAGNAWEWVKGDIAPGPPFEGGNNFVSQQPWTAGLNRSEMWGPAGNYVSKNSGEYGGLGNAFLGFSIGVIIRGGSFVTPANSGLFSTLLGSFGPLGSGNTTGFRCAFVP